MAEDVKPERENWKEKHPQITPITLIFSLEHLVRALQRRNRRYLWIAFSRFTQPIMFPNRRPTQWRQKMILTRDKVEQFNSDGYLFVENLFDAEEMDLLIRIAKNDQHLEQQVIQRKDCLLYTSDAADERSS